MAGESARKDALNEALRTLQDELRSIEEQAAQLRTAISAINSLLGTPEWSQAAALADRAAVAKPSDSEPRGTMIGMAEEVLLAAGHPMHIKDIMEAMVVRGFKHQGGKAFRYSLGRTLDRKAEHGKTFTKNGPALYGLRVWRSRTNNLFDDDELGK